MIHIWTTTTNFQPDQHYLIDPEKYNEFLVFYKQGTEKDYIDNGLNQGWIKSADQNGNEI